MNHRKQLLRCDYARMQPGRKYSVPRLLDAAFTNPGMMAAFMFRLQSIFFERGWLRLASAVRFLNNSMTGADILPGCTIGPGVLFPHPTAVVIGHGVVIGMDCTILQSVTIGEKFADGRPPHDYPVLGDRVVIGAGAVILGRVTLGSDVSVAANSVVISDVPSGSVVAGSPARVIRAGLPTSGSVIPAAPGHDSGSPSRTLKE